MLVLSRKPGERIRIGPDIVITLIRLGPNTARIGIEAPGHQNIVREELLYDVASEESGVSGDRQPEHAEKEPHAAGV